MENKRIVFISYSWEDEAHNQRVEQFVTLLRKNNIYVLYDRDMPLGERITDFMEMINRSEYVLFLCTPKYKEKADLGLGGVKYEKNIITAELYEKRNETKFIPVLFSGTWNESLPIWAKGKLGIDYTREDFREFDKLLNHLQSNNIKSDADIKSITNYIIQPKVRKIRKYIIFICIISIIFLIIFVNNNLLIVNKHLENYEYNPSKLIDILDEDLRKLLGDEYQYFIDCFDTIGDTRLYEDGIFINGYVKGIVSYMSGVLCVDTDGFIYVLLIEPEDNISYYTNNPEKNSTLPLNKFNGRISYWLEDYNTYHVSFKSALINNEDVEGIYVKENATIEVKVNDNNTISISGFASNGANTGDLECLIKYTRYFDGAYAKYICEYNKDDYFVFYFGNKSLSVLDRAPSNSGMGVSFEGEYFKYKSNVE